ncbi:hypothetical protein C0J52_16407 [Blattella germanica]|nr:hypothetical protein C0J52_16407 [Blattella germanica]
MNSSDQGDKWHQSLRVLPSKGLHNQTPQILYRLVIVVQLITKIIVLIVSGKEIEKVLVIAQIPVPVLGTGNNFLVNPGHCDNISLYYHPSMLEDPWAELEKKLQTSMAVQNCSLGSKGAVEKSVSNLSSVDSVLSLSDSDEGPDMETDSTVSASDGSS